MKRFLIALAALVIMVGFGSLSLFTFRLLEKNSALASTVSSLQGRLNDLEKNAVSEKTNLEKQNSTLEKGISTLSQENANLKKSVSGLADAQAQAQARAQALVREQANVARQKTPDEEVTSAVSAVSPSVVSVVVYGESVFGEQVRLASGSGFIISRNGYLATNRHVAPSDQYTYSVILANGSEVPAKLVKVDDNADLSILKIDGTFTPVKLGNSDGLKVGQSIIAIGNALGRLNNTVSVGIVSGLNRDVRASGDGIVEDLNGLIQTDAAINPGNSGGPLVDLKGNVVGINVAVAQSSNSISFAIPINAVRASLSPYL